MVYKSKMCAKMFKVKPHHATVVFIFSLLIRCRYVNGAVECSGGGGSSSDTQSVFSFGLPIVFAGTESQEFNPYSLVDIHKRTAIMDEYLMVGYHRFPDEYGVMERLRLVLIDSVKTTHIEIDEKPDLVRQNLEKELYLRFFNSTGVYPWLAIVNTTTNRQIKFSVNNFFANKTNGISYVIKLREQSYFYEPQVPFDALFEIPGNSRVLRSEKTLIQYQSFSLWRFKLSNTTVEWSEVKSVTPINSTKKCNQADFIRIDNPCTKDLFLVYTERGSSSTETDGDGSSSKIYLGSPLIQSHLKENWLYDLTTEDHPWSPDIPSSIVLTNDHFVVLTKTSLWVSESLNNTPSEEDLEMIKPYEERPDLNYILTDPCSGFEEHITCFYNSTDNDTFPTEQKLFYNPVCYLYQVPYYRDYLIFVAKSKMNEDEFTFSVLYSAKPYHDWKILFSNVYYYRRYLRENGTQITKLYRILDIVGIIFNHHTKQFDITIKATEFKNAHENIIMFGGQRNQSEVLNGSDVESNNETEKHKHHHNNNMTVHFIRFSLHESKSTTFNYGRVVNFGHHDHPDYGMEIEKELDGVMGKGFTDFIFPDNFYVESVVMNGYTQDVFFLGNQLWIAEAGGTFIYPAISGLNHETSVCDDSGEETETDILNRHYDMIRECSFNHPDRTFVCMNENRDLLIVGKIGSTYSPIVTKIEEIQDFQKAQAIHAWSSAYLCEVVKKRAVFVAGYSGKIIMWYMYEPDFEASEATKLLSNPEDDPSCKGKSIQPDLCDTLKSFPSGCSAKAVGKTGFKMLAIDASKLSPRKVGYDGPLVPLLIDSSHALLFEGIVPQVPNENGNVYNSYFNYFSDVNVGQKILCKNYEWQKKDRNNPSQQHNCELFIRHIKSVEGYLEGFRRALYVTILKSIPMLPIPADLVILEFRHSNKVHVKINDHMNQPKWEFNEKHIGQTLYLPGNFSVLLSGFPGESKEIMEGYTTLYFSYENRLIYHAFYAFLMDLSTVTYRTAQLKLQDLNQENERNRLKEMDLKAQLVYDAEIETRKNTEDLFFSTSSATDRLGNDPFFNGEVPPVEPRMQIEERMLTISDDTERSQLFPNNAPPGSVEPVQELPEDTLVYGKVPYEHQTVWHVEENDCDYSMTLGRNPVVKHHGGRISLDLHDRVSIRVQLKSKTKVGKLMMYRPLMVITNSNPKALKIEKREMLSGNPQVISLMLAPTGFQKGVAVVSIRNIASSMKCPHTTSISFIVLIHRDVGRRLHVNYRIPSCKPSVEHGMYPRLWYTELPGCVSRQEILSRNSSEIYRYRKNRRHKTYITLPPNYRPPSSDGTDIPKSKNIYNADPSKPRYKTWYSISHQTFEYELCKGKPNKSECLCTHNDRIIDDEHFTECKEKVFYIERTGAGRPLDMSVTYDRLMRDEDQDEELFLKKVNWSVTIEEVNGRSEWYVISSPSMYLAEINSNDDLHEGMRHYDMENFSVGLLGTGLYHFKVTLGRFESFDPVTGYFILFAAANDVNFVHAFMIAVGTILFCMTMVFFGFIAARKRLSSMLPIQPMSAKRKLKLM